MKRDVAEELMSMLLECHRILSEAEAVVNLRMEDSEEKTKIRRGVLSGVGVLYTDVMMDIIAQYPDLDPEA